MIRTLPVLLVLATPFVLSACDKAPAEKASSTSGESAQAPAPEPKITPENLDAELDKLDAEMAAE